MKNVVCFKMLPVMCSSLPLNVATVSYQKRETFVLHVSLGCLCILLTGVISGCILREPRVAVSRHCYE